MSHAQRGLQHEVLLIRPVSRESPNPCGQGADAMLSAVCGEYDVATDVYRGLALIGLHRKAAPTEDALPRAVVICVDELGPAEFEFFSLVPRIRPGLPVFVLGSEHLQSKVEQALKLGATGVASTSALIQGLKTRRGDPQSAPVTPDGKGKRKEDIPESVSPQQQANADPAEAKAEPAKVELTEPSPVAHPKPSAPSVVDAEATEEDGRDGDETRPVSVQVPWMRRANGPKRVAPQRAAPSPLRESHTPPTHDEDGPDGPLLTNAELQALIGDDVSAIAPQERRTGSTQDDTGEEGEG